MDMVPQESNIYIMHKDTEIKNTKQCCEHINDCLQKVKQLETSSEVSVAIMKLQEAVMWLNINLKHFNCEDKCF